MGFECRKGFAVDEGTGYAYFCRPEPSVSLASYCRCIFYGRCINRRIVHKIFTRRDQVLAIKSIIFLLATQLLLTLLISCSAADDSIASESLINQEEGIASGNGMILYFFSPG